MTINTVGILNLSTLFGALFEFLHLLRRYKTHATGW
jgi:hypothetical protein